MMSGNKAELETSENKEQEQETFESKEIALNTPEEKKKIEDLILTSPVITADQIVSVLERESSEKTLFANRFFQPSEQVKSMNPTKLLYAKEILNDALKVLDKQESHNHKP